MNCANCLNSYVDMQNLKVICDKDVVCNGEFYEPIIQEVNNKEMVNHPSHYNQGIETIEYIESWSMNFNTGNVIKYVTRAGYKNDKLEDLKKAMWYLQREIDRIENK